MAIVSKIAKVASKSLRKAAGKGAAKDKSKAAAATKRVRDRAKKKKPLTEKQKEAAKRSAAYKKRVKENKKKRDVEKLKVLQRKVERKKVKKQKEKVAARSKGKISAAPTTGRAGEYSGGQLRSGRKSTADGEESLAEIKLGREIKEYGGSGPVGKARGGEKINVGNEVALATALTNRSPKRKAAIKEAARIESKKDAGEKLTKADKDFIKAYDATEATKAMKQTGQLKPAGAKIVRGFDEPKKGPDAEQTAKLKEQRLKQERFQKSALRYFTRKELQKRQKEAQKKAAKKKMMSGGMVTKSNKGHMDFRKGGLLLASVDNRKKKK